MQITFNRAVLFSLCICVVSTASSQDHDFSNVGTKRSPTAVSWGGRLWKTTETASFQGRPETSTQSDTTNFITVAYSRYVTFYDVKNHTPRWVAYVTDRKSFAITEAQSRSGPDFDRPSQFFTDGVIADAGIPLGVEPLEHFDFSDKVPPGLTGTDVIPQTISAVAARSRGAIIERGHLAPNNTMKTWGTTAQGKKAQFESFSLLNVVPQMKKHNAPTWSALERQCLVWANELGTVSVVVGPVFPADGSLPMILDRRTGNPEDIPIPEALFCVVVGKRAGQVSAIGFVMPQQTATYSFRDKAVTIDVIEERTGINFLPKLGEPNVLETAVDVRWTQQ